MTDGATSATAIPPIVDRQTWNAQIDELRVREKAHTREGDAIAAARRRLPMVGVDPATPLAGPAGEVRLIDTFEGRTQLFASYMMWYDGAPAAGQCEGCTKDNSQVRELSYLHSRDVTFAVFCQGPFPQSDRYREFLGWEMPLYSVPETSREALIGQAAARSHSGRAWPRATPTTSARPQHRPRATTTDGQR